jgi:GINS complex subunit 1
MVWNGNDILDLAVQQQKGPNEGQNRGADLGNSEGNSSSLSPEEEEYVRQYSDLLAAYKGQWTDIDLTGSLEPPRDLFIDVRVLKDAGEIQTEYGWVQILISDDNWLIKYVAQLILPRTLSSMSVKETSNG